ncbi:MAG: hypothetical protein IKZ98_14220 [Clostridia bacterium]|nr:hypothetical protein [Clostridia bacterium]
MKRFLSVILILSLIFSISISYADNYSSMTDEELKEQLSLIRNELTIRGFKAEKKTVILDQNGVQIYINGEIWIDRLYSWSDSYSLYIPVVVVNDTNKNITLYPDNASLNGWTTDITHSMDTIPAGKKAKGNLLFALGDTDVERLSDFEDAEFTIKVYNKDDWFGDMVVEQTKPITIYANK